MVTPLLPHAESVAGGALGMFGQLAELATRHEVTLVTFAGPHASDRHGLDTLAALNVEVHPVRRERPRGMGRWQARGRLAFDWLRGAEPLRTLKFRDSRLQDIVDRLGRDRRFDLIQIEDNAMGAYRYPDHVATVLTEHEVRVGAASSREAEGGPASSPLLRFEASRWSAYQRRVWRRFDRIQVFTERDAAALRTLAPDIAERIRVNPFGVTVGPAADPALEAEGEVVFVGAFHHPPNVAAARWLGREIFPLLRQLSPRAHLTIVGSDPPRPVRALAGPAITVTGWVPRVEPWLERAAVVLAPIQVGGGMRVKVLQAMALGKAVVTTPLGAEGLAQGDPGLPLALREDAAGLAQAAAALLGDDAARRDLGRRARAFVLEHHAWPAYVRRLEAIYAELGGPG
jgi:glycosyltransferase involved in cell wall biosynthesis